VSCTLAKSTARGLSFGKSRVAALLPFVHDRFTPSWWIPGFPVGGQRRLWQFAPVCWGISVRLSPLAVLIVLSIGAASANDRYSHLRSLNDYLVGHISEEGVLEGIISERCDPRSGGVRSRGTGAASLPSDDNPQLPPESTMTHITMMGQKR
jgi:hypothetical protein